jgi:hypothetical protein
MIDIIDAGSHKQDLRKLKSVFYIVVVLNEEWEGAA